MFKLLVILLMIKLYTRNDISKQKIMIIEHVNFPLDLFINNIN